MQKKTPTKITRLRQGIELINQTEMAAKRPVIQNETTQYPWEDSDLMPLLVRDMRDYHERYQPEDIEEEKLAIKLANNLVEGVNKRESINELEDRLRILENSTSEYVRNRLNEISYNLLESALVRKGLLITGEGGIGKTFFLYELAEECKIQGLNFAIIFRSDGIKHLYQLNLDDIPECFPEGIIFIVDACNELDDQARKMLFELIPKILDMPKASIVVSTRTESLDSHEDELEKALLAKKVFLGVSPYDILSFISEYSESVFFQFQDMLFSNNPRNLHAIKAAIGELAPGEDGLSAHTQRTKLIESCVKKQMNVVHWEATKRICKYLYRSKKINFSLKEVKEALDSDPGAYLREMISTGFITSFQYDGGPLYTFSSESQMHYLIARSLNDDLNDIAFNENDLPSSAKLVAELVANKVGYLNEHEMCQVAIDRYCNKGAVVVPYLLRAFGDADLRFDVQRILRETIYPLDSDFSEVIAINSAEPDFALLKFGGYVNIPFNLKSYTHTLLLANPAIIMKFNFENWHKYDVGELIHRIKNISYYAFCRENIQLDTEFEWLWLSVWASSATNTELRIWGQRLMFVMCDASINCLTELLSLWDQIQDIYIRRAIAKTLASMRTATISEPIIESFIQKTFDDPEVVDAVILTYLADTTKGRLSIVNARTKNLYKELSKEPVSSELIEDAQKLIHVTDMLIQHYFPFDVMQSDRGSIDFRGSDVFLDAPKEEVEKWNRSFSDMLSCPPNSPCEGLYVSHQDVSEIVPMGFSKEHHDGEALMRVFTQLLDAAFKSYGGDLKNRLGKFESSGYGREESSKPDIKPISEAVGRLIGSLASNYYIDEIVIANPPYEKTGFISYEREFYQEPGKVHSIMPASNRVIDNARIKFEHHIESPDEKDDSWFDDTEEVFKELIDLLKPIRLGKRHWQPIAFVARSKMKSGHELQRSNELFVSIAYDSRSFLKNDHDDRYLTIEHKEYLGNFGDYSQFDSSLCMEFSRPEYIENDQSSYRMLVPPSNMVQDLGLSYKQKTGEFVDRLNGKTIIICDGNPRNFYEEPVSDLILMDVNVYQDLIDLDKVKFFAFTERFHPERGYGNDCDRHWEFKPDATIINSFSNRGGIDTGEAKEAEQVPEECRRCYFSEEESKKRRDKHFEELSESDPSHPLLSWIKFGYQGNPKD